MKIPFGLFQKKPIKATQVILAADVGGTKTHLSLYQFENNRISLIRENTFKSTDYTAFQNMLEDFNWNTPAPDSICIAFAGPILNGRARATNFDWIIEREKISQELGVPRVTLINDMVAHAYGLFILEEHEFHTIQKGNGALKGNAAIIAPGTGLGEAGLFWDGTSYYPFATEGGHTDFAPRDDFDDTFLLYLRKKYGHVSWERLISGMGICEIYDYVQTLQETKSSLFKDIDTSTKDKAAIISKAAKNGDAQCQMTVELFYKYLAVESANLAVQLNTSGGIFIAGGIVPKNLDLLNVESFLAHFHNHGRFTYILEQVPVQVVLNDRTALLGAAYAGAYS